MNTNPTIYITRDDDEGQAEEYDSPEKSSILEKDHPLLEKFQKTLKEHLLRVQAQLIEEIADLDHTIKVQDEEREDIGAKLYDMQQKIDEQRDSMDEFNKQIAELSDKRRKHEENSKILRKDFYEKFTNHKDAKRVHNERLQEITNLQILENSMARWTQEVKDEVKLAKRVVSKDGKDQTVVAEEKRKMDLFIQNMDAEVRRRQTELNNINEQIVEQRDNIDALNSSLSDANADLEELQHEHKRLLQAWGEVIVSIQYRDKMLAKANAELNDEYEEHKLIDANIEGTKKATQKEKEQNAKLTQFQKRLTLDVVTLEAQVKKEQQEEIGLTEKVESCAAIMEQTEIDLKQATQEGLVFEHHLKALRSKLEKQDKKKFAFEEQILELLQSQITTGIAGDHRGKTLGELQKQRRKLVISMSATESQLSHVLLDLEKWRGKVTRAGESVEDAQKHHNTQEAISDQVMNEINMVKSSINGKQRILDTLNKQLQQLISIAGGQEIAPEMLRIVELEKTIADIDGKIKEMQGFWVRLQSIVVSLSEKRSKQMNGIHIARKQLLVIEQKALKLEHEIENVVADDKEISRSLATTVGKLELLNGKLFERKKVHAKDEVECELAHQNVTNRLKDAEMQVLELEQLLSALQLEIIDTKDVVMEKHREALSWETKYKLSIEAKKYRDEELAKTSEIGCMRAEIHRMDVRLAQLKRAQEKLVHDLQNSVHHRSHIFDAASTREKIAGSKCKQRYTIHHKLNELKNKIKHVNVEALQLDRTVFEISNQQRMLSTEIETKKQEVEDETNHNQKLQTEIEQGLLLKQENLENIVRKQYRARRYRALLNGRQKSKIRSETQIQSDYNHQKSINEELCQIMENLQLEVPEQKFGILKIIQTLKTI